MNSNITLTPDQLKKILGNDQNYQTVTEDLQNKIFERIAQSLVEEDFQQIEKLNQEDDAEGSKVKNYILTKVPNLDKIVEEETRNIQVQP